MSRDALTTAFLDRAGWGAAARAPLAGDASNRRYLRLTGPEGSAILMDAPAERGEDVRPFTVIARHLLGIGLSAPQIMAEDAANGFLLIEDLGDALFARVIPSQPELEAPLYVAATDVLVHLHAHPSPPLDRYDPRRMTELAALAFTKYQAAAASSEPAAHDRFVALFQPLLNDNLTAPDVLVQRDYHAENLIWLPDRQGVARVGLLDFQDAMLGHPAYDLVSLLTDARRDVPAALAAQMIAHYLDRTGAEPGGFQTAFALLNVQRNMRILGVFARLCTEYGKPHYLRLMPRVWGHLQTGLDHPALGPVADLVRAALPAPTPETLERIRQCHPTP